MLENALLGELTSSSAADIKDAERCVDELSSVELACFVGIGFLDLLWSSSEMRSTSSSSSIRLARVGMYAMMVYVQSCMFC